MCSIDEMSRIAIEKRLHKLRVAAVYSLQRLPLVLHPLLGSGSARHGRGLYQQYKDSIQHRLANQLSTNVCQFRIDVAQNQTAHSSRWVEMVVFGFRPSIKILSDLRQIRLSMPREVRIAFDPASGKIAILSLVLQTWVEVESDCHPGSRKKMASSEMREGRLDPEARKRRDSEGGREFAMQAERIRHAYGAGFGDACMTFCLCLLGRRRWIAVKGPVRSQWWGRQYPSDSVLALHILRCDELQHCDHRDVEVQI
ncbi:hypothetical protein KCU93_g309, partial [Aureobasidium melanogenum]